MSNYQLVLASGKDEMEELRENRINNLRMSSEIMRKLSELLERNKNVGIKMIVCDEGYTLFPPRAFKLNGGRVSATIFITDNGTEIYPPGTTCGIDVANIGLSKDGEMIQIDMRPFDSHLKKCSMLDKIRQYNGPEREEGIPFERVQEIFSQVEEDILEIFEIER